MTKQDETPQTDFSQLHFLVVDDDADSLATIVEYLQSMGAGKITRSRDGAEAIRLLERDPTINFVVSDWDMPLMNGISLLQRVRSHPARAHIPFMIVTSPISHESEKIIVAAESMVDAYLIKPFRGEVLKEKIDKVLSAAVHGPQKEVVVIDDDPDAREMVTEYLSEMGFREIRAVADGKVALDYLSKNASKIGLIISDWEMPEMSGMDLLQACKNAKALAEVPFLMITSQTSLERIKVLQAARASVDQYLLKPFRGDELRSRVETLLERNRVRGEVRQLTLDGLRDLERGYHKPATEKLEAALKLDPEHDLALRGMGDLLSKTKGVESALPYYKKALESNPNSPNGYLRLAAAYEQIGWLDRAIQLLQIGVRQIGFRADLHYSLGRLYNKKGYLPFAKSEFERAIEIQPDHAEARAMLMLIEEELAGKPK
ncbi:MAG: response regulator [Oligoflexia bacterium]|nr:response regulator [Oligoflexia bacterium]